MKRGEEREAEKGEMSSTCLEICGVTMGGEKAFSTCSADKHHSNKKVWDGNDHPNNTQMLIPVVQIQ